MAYLFRGTLWQRTFQWFGRRRSYQLAIRLTRWDKERPSEPHVVGLDPPTPENDPIGRFRLVDKEPT